MGIVSDVREHAVDIALLLCVVAAFGVLIATSGVIVFYIFCGLAFMSVACYTVRFK